MVSEQEMYTARVARGYVLTLRETEDWPGPPVFAWRLVWFHTYHEYDYGLMDSWFDLPTFACKYRPRNEFC